VAILYILAALVLGSDALTMREGRELAQSDSDGVFLTGFGHHSEPTPAPAIVEADPNSPAYAAPLNEAGYLEIAKMESTADMTVFTRRLLTSLNFEVASAASEQGLYGLVPFYSGERAMQSFASLKQELLAVGAVSTGWLAEAKPTGSVLLSENQDRWDSVSAPLNDAGYQAIAGRKDHNAMWNFMRRTVYNMGFQVINEGRMQGVVNYYSGEIAVQTFANLRNEIIGQVKDTDAWATNGDSAVLSEFGYTQVAAMKNRKQMRIFLDRLAEHLGCKILDDDYLVKNIAIFDGHTSKQSYAWLDMKVREACQITDAVRYGSVHKVVGKGGVLQLRLENSTRYQYSASQLQSAGIVPTQFAATNAKTASKEQLSKACPLKTDPEAAGICKEQEFKLGITVGLGGGCTSKVEQAITDSHRRALLAAQAREDEWTIVMEDDVVPLHPGYFDEEFDKMWTKVPSWAKLVRLSWCTFEADLGSIRKKTYANAGKFRLIQTMSWFDEGVGVHRYYTGGCTTGYMVHKSFLPELIGVFPCCCPIDCCMERQLFYAPTKPIKFEGHFRGEQVMVNMDAWDSKMDSYNYTNFYQGGVFVQDNREIKSERPEWNTQDSE